MTRNQFAKHVKDLPIEKREKIVTLLHEAKSAINSVECELQNTPIEHDSLLRHNAPTLWCLIYELTKLFDYENHQ